MPVSQQPDQETPVQNAPNAQHTLASDHRDDARTQTKNSGGLLRRILLVVALLAVAALVYWKLKSNKAEADQTTARTVASASRPVPVTVSAVVTRTMPIYLTELGTVTAFNTVTIKSRVDGQLLTVNVREGQQVKQGQVLATIDARPFQAAVAQAEGQLAKDQAAANYSKAEAGRYTALYEAGVVSKESQQTQISNAGQNTGTLEADRAAIQAARVNVAYARITSPINGVVGLRQVDAGNIVHAADTTGLLVVTQLQPITVIFTLPEDSLPEVLKLVHTGKKLVVEAFDRSQTTHLASGTLLTVDNQIDTTTGTVKVKAVFDNRDGALFPNQFVNIRLVLEQRQNSLVIPASALQTGTQGDFVYVARPCPESGCPRPANAPDAGAGAAGGKPAGKPANGQPTEPEQKGPKYFVDVVPVVVDLTEGSQIILKSGVQPGDMVVIDGQEKLKKNSPVKPSLGRSNSGGPSTQQIGADGNNAGGAPQPSRPDQAIPEPRAQGRRAGSSHQSGQTGNPGNQGNPR